MDRSEAPPGSRTFPGIGVEAEWSNKDEFFDRDLINFEMLHRVRGLAVGIVITRATSLHDDLRSRGPEWRQRFGSRTTYWDKLVPRLDLGRGGATPLVAFGLELERVGS